jgi:hypothetical protein
LDFYQKVLKDVIKYNREFWKALKIDKGSLFFIFWKKLIQVDATQELVALTQISLKTHFNGQQQSEQSQSKLFAFWACQSWESQN